MRISVPGVLTAVLAALLVSFAAYGGGASEPAAAAASTTAPSQAYVVKDYSKEAPLKVSFTGIAWGNGAEENGLVEQEFEKRLNLDMTCSWIPYTDYHNRVNLMMVSGNVTDVMQVYPIGGKAYYPQFLQAVKNGVFHDLTPYVLGNGFKDSNAILKNWSSAIWENCKYKGKLYIIPRKTNEMASMSAVWYRKDIFDKSGLKEPTTVDELADFIIAMDKAAGEGMYGLAFSANDLDGQLKAITVAYTGVDHWAVDANGNLTFQSFMPEYKSFLAWARKLFDAGAMDPEFALNRPKTSSFEDGKSAVKIYNWYNWNQSEDLVTTKWFSTSVPAGAQVWGIGPLQGPKAPAVSVGDGSGYSQPVAISNKFAAKDLDRLLQAICRADKDYLWFLHYGLENVHYTMVDGQPSAITDEQKAAKKLGYVGGWNQVLLDEDPDYIATKFVRAHSSAAAIAQARKIQAAGNEAIAKYKIGNAILTLDSETYNAKWTNLTKDLLNNRAKVVMGQMSMDQWDAYVKEIVASDDYKKITAELKAASGR